MEEEKRKIRFKDLSWPVKISILVGWFMFLNLLILTMDLIMGI